MYDYLNLPPCAGNFYRQPPQGSQFPSLPGTTLPSTLPSQGIPTFPIPQIGTEVPTGVPAGPIMGGFPPLTGAPGGTLPIPTTGTTTTPIPTIAPPGEISPLTMQDIAYTPGFLRTQIGKRVRVEFLIGTSSMTDRTGTLLGVGASYILIRLEDSDDIMLCDLYSIKFVTFFM